MTSISAPKKKAATASSSPHKIRVHFMPLWAPMLSMDLLPSTTVAQTLAALQPQLTIEPSDELYMSVNKGVSLECHAHGEWAIQSYRQLSCRKGSIKDELAKLKKKCTRKARDLRTELRAIRQRLSDVQKDFYHGNGHHIKYTGACKQTLRQIGVSDESVVYVRIINARVREISDRVDRRLTLRRKW